MSSINTELLIAQCKKHNTLAQMNLYKAYCKAMFRVAYRITQNTELAEDVVQEAFLTAFDDLHKLTDSNSFGSWLKRIVIFKSINLVKKNKKHAFINFDEVSYKIPEENSIDDTSITDLKLNEVYNAITNLKENYRLILTLYYIEGFDYEEIAEITQLSYANCRTTISRAKESLRKKLTVYAS